MSPLSARSSSTQVRRRNERLRGTLRQRLLHRVEERIRLLSAGYADLPVEDEEGHAADAGVSSFHIGLKNEIAVGVAREIALYRALVEPRTRRYARQRVMIVEVFAVDEIRFEER